MKGGNYGGTVYAGGRERHLKRMKAARGRHLKKMKKVHRKGWGKLKKFGKKIAKKVKGGWGRFKKKVKKATKRKSGGWKVKGWGRIKKHVKKVIKRVKAHKHGFKHWMNKLKKLKFKKAPARKCAREHARNGGNVCKCHGLVTYGARGKFSRKHVRGQITCNNANFGDPIHGVVKDCFCQSKARRMHKRR